MGLRKLERSSQTPPGWRLASVEEAMENLEWIKQNHMLEEWDRVRLLDGWIGGQGYNFNVEVGFRSCLGYMLLVQSPTPEISNADDRDVPVYSKVPELSEEGINAAVLLCSEDSNEEVLYWLMGSKTEGDETKAASEVVSAIARKWQGVHAKSRQARTESSLEDLTIAFRNSLKALVANTGKSLRALIVNENSEQGKIIDEILQEVSSVINGSDLTNMFQDILQEVVKETVWPVLVEKVAWQTFNILSRNLYGRVVMHSDPSLGNMIRYAYDYVGQALKEVWKGNRDFKRFPMFDCKGITVFFGNTIVTPDVLSTCLLAAAYDADVSLVKRLIERGVQPSAISEENGNTVLHYAAEMMHDSDRYKIAEMLLRGDESRADAIGWEHRTALHIAAKNGDDTMCTLLCYHNASLTVQNSYGCTPLHFALRRSYDEVVRVLISAEGEDRTEGSSRLVDIRDSSGETSVDYAIQYTNVNMVVWLLSLSSQPESYFATLNEQLSVYLRESSRIGYVDLVQKLLEGGADPFQGDDEGKTALHYAAECAKMVSEEADPFDSDDSFEGAEKHVAWKIIQKLLFDKELGSINWGKASVSDKYGRNALHVAAFLGQKDLCYELLRANRNLIDSKDRDGQSALYYAVAGPHDDTDVLDIILEEQGTNQVFVKDFSQTTPLHVATAGGNLKMVVKLLSEISGEERKECVEAPDVLGQTALHKAASGGHWEVIQKLLNEGADPLKERDSDGKTALYFAAQADGERAVKIAEVLLNSCKSPEQRSLLLFASEDGIGLPSNSSLDKYLKEEKSKIEETLKADNSLRVAAKLGDIDMTLECITRGGNIAVIRNEQWIANLSSEEKTNVRDVLKKIKTIVEQGTDKPALEDNLGRSPFAIGLAALFLNPFVKSPVTVGISGEWGMGKSSVMIQTESILLKTAAQLAFKNSFQKNKLLGTGESKLSITGQGKLRKIADAVESLDAKNSKITMQMSKRLEEKRKKGATQQEVLQKTSEVTNLKKILRLREFWNALRAMWNKFASPTSENLSKFSDFLENYQPRYHQILKCLAIMDRSDMFEEEEESRSRNESASEMQGEEDSLQGITPSILTVRYNAWHYKDETEALAGLAVEITKELEATMTVAHKLRTSWIYNWKNCRDSICLKVIFPFFLQVVVAIFLSIIVWLVFGTAHNKDIKKLKYGGVPASIIVAAWGLGKSVISFVKPITSQVQEYLCLPDHSQKLGYHQKVIDDINFLKEQLSYRPSWMWKMFAFIWCCITLSWDENNITGTKIRKFPPACGNNLRMIVFVDDLDRCEESVILQVLSAVNLVLATCEINVILSMENSMIQRAILRKYGDNNSNANNNKSNEELAEKYLRKIVQLPLHLPDPSDSESNDFLKRQLGMWDRTQRSTDPVAEKEKLTAHGRTKKVNPKFQIEPATLDKFIEDEGRKEYFAESVHKLQRALGLSDTHMVQQGLVQRKDQETIEKAEGSGVEEAKIEKDETPHIEQSQENSGVDATIEIGERDEQQKRIEKGGITQIINYVCALPSLCNKYLRSRKQTDETTKGDEQDDQQQREGRERKRGHMDDLSSIISAMLIPKYTLGEKSAFSFLHIQCTGSRKLPREWKCLMAYHRLAWNILYLTFHQKDVNPVEGWQVQLIAWIFVSWEWRDLITILIKKWNKLKALRNWKGTQGPSLREIVELYIDEELPADKKSTRKMEDQSTKKKDDAIDRSSMEQVAKTSGNMTTTSREEETEGDDYLRKILKEQEEMREVLRKVQEDMREVLKEQKEMRDTLEMVKMKFFREEKDNEGESSKEYQRRIIKKIFMEEEDTEGESSLQLYSMAEKNQKTQKAKDKEEREEWLKLRDTLRRYNVSMDGIQAFQKFRFYCQPGHLPWPLPEQANFSH